jgi:hypothetical protein
VFDFLHGRKRRLFEAEVESVADWLLGRHGVEGALAVAEVKLAEHGPDSRRGKLYLAVLKRLRKQ